MRSIKAYRKKLLYNADKYRVFLKNRFLNLKPTYYVVSANTEVDTPDGPMCAITITADIENPEQEPIAEIFINSEFVYLWQNHCWVVAVDKKDRPISTAHIKTREQLHSTFGQGPVAAKPFTNTIPPCNKTLVIYKIGTQEIE